MAFENRETLPDGPMAIIALTRHGVNLALQLQSRLPGSICCVPLRHRFALAMGAKGFERLESLISGLWDQHRALIFIMATGIVVRKIAPLLRHKAVDPAVVVLDEKGQFVISLVSGHLGGANLLAAEIARITGGRAVITTASDVQDKPALDLIAGKAGLQVENPGMLGRAARAILDDETLWVYDPEGRLRPYLGDSAHCLWLAAEPKGEDPDPARAMDAANVPAAGVGLWVGERLAPQDMPWLLLRPRNLVVGVGCNRGTAADEILEFLQTVFARENLSQLSIRNFASVDVKSNEAGILEAGKRLDRPIHFFHRKEIETVTVPNPSNTVLKHIGVRSVCEASALLSAHSKKLIVPKQKTANVTLAVARVAFP